MRNTGRVIRVFISSTFRDMQEEREELVKRVFPKLRKMCEKRGVVWSEVDLRWGVTDEQKAEGKVLPICLEEIERCRPYFIGLLGEKYGWIPEEIPDELCKAQPWLNEHLRHSVTELEILHGTLLNPDMSGHAFFYFRDPAYIQTLPFVRRVDFTGEKPENAEKLQALKNKIRRSGFPVREDYPNPKVLGELVLQDLTALIDRLYPEPQAGETGTFDREASEHTAFEQNRLRVYIKRQEYFDRLDTHLSSDGPPLAVLGESGSGKSALLANWIDDYTSRNPETPVIRYYVGATPYSSDWENMLRRVSGELDRLFSLGLKLPEKREEMRAFFTDALNMAAARGRAIVVLDALDRLEDRDGALDLAWLPAKIPANIRLTVSTLYGRTSDAIRKRGWEEITIKRLEADERRKLVTVYLAQYAKSLNPARTERLATAQQTANPLFLRILLEELRIFGEHEHLDERIEYYLQAETAVELYEKVLDRWERDYETDRPLLVRDSMTAIWAARHGLTEAELLDLLDSGNQNTGRAAWSVFYLAAEKSLDNRSGFISFYHDYLRQAVEKRYLADPKLQRAAHLRLAGYFKDRDLGLRKAEELPYQYLKAEDRNSLVSLLSGLDFFEYAWGNDYDRDIVHYWQELSDYKTPGACYKQKIKKLKDSGAQPSDIIPHLRKLGSLMDRMAFFKECIAFRLQAAEIDQKLRGEDDKDTADDWRWVGLSYYMQGDFNNALSYLNRALEIHKRLEGPETEETADLLSDISLLNWEFGRYEEAGDLCEKCLELRERLLGQEHKDVALSLNNLAAIYHVQGFYDKALPLYERALSIRERVLSPEDTDVAQTVNNMGGLYYYLGRYAESVECHLRALKIYEQVYGGNHPYIATICGNLAISYAKTDKHAEAKKYILRAKEITESIYGSCHPNIINCYLNYANICARLGDRNEGLKYKKSALEQAEAVYGSDHQQVAFILKDLAGSYILMNDTDNARPLLERAMSIYSRILKEPHPELADIMQITGWYCERTGNEEKAAQQYRKALEMHRVLFGPENSDLISLLFNLGEVLIKLKGYKESLEIFKEADHLCLLHKRDDLLEKSAKNQAFIHEAIGKGQ